MRVLEVFLAFLGLGLTSFGGPLAHLGYFHQALVRRRGWLSEVTYAQLVALAQALPGPTSSQVGMALGLFRAGPLGALAAWLGFTLPSALLLYLVGVGLEAFSPPPGLSQGLKVLALAVVAQALGQMAQGLAPDRPRLAIAFLTAVLLTLWPQGQLPALLMAGVLGLFLPLAPPPPPSLQALSPRAGALAFLVFLGLGLLLRALAPLDPLWAFLEALYTSGALVFGGGHVVLPLLKEPLVPEFLDAGTFLAGYGAAQAVPGPLFSLAAFLGAKAHLGLPSPLAALLALLALFLPGALLLFAALPFWAHLGQIPALRRALMGVNAGVVGLLLAALYDPLFLEAVRGKGDFALALGLFGLLRLGLPPWALALLGATLGALFL